MLSLTPFVTPFCFFAAAIGSFTVVDGAQVTAADLGNNFFVEAQHVGKPRAQVEPPWLFFCFRRGDRFSLFFWQVTMELLQELNDDVTGDCLAEDPVALIKTAGIKDFVNKYSAIIASQLDNDSILALAKVCWEADVPLFVLHVNGMVGTLRIQMSEHVVIESKPEPDRFDLRLGQPFPELLELAQNIDYESLDGEHHGHVPWVLILIKLVQEFRAANDAKAPAFRDRSHFVEALKKMRRDSDEENFQQAQANLRTALMPASQQIPDDVREVLGDDKAATTDADSADFWVLARAVREFVACAEDGNGLLPLPGKIPDMVSDTQAYMELQKVYAAKAEADLNAVQARVQRILEAVGKSGDSISQNDIQLFCRNVQNLRCLRPRSIEEEFAGPVSPKVAELLSEGTQESADTMWYLISRGADAFKKAHGRSPGGAEGDYSEDVQPLKECVLQATKDLGLEEAVTAWDAKDNSSLDELVTEYCRFGGSELHALSSIMGGIVSQEVLKVVTRQFVPFESWICFNGITSTTSKIVA